jgi:4'-phosphopantetheinyl transferase
VAVTRAPGVGVDVELASPYLNVGDLEADVPAPQETSTLRGLDSVGRRCGLLAYWTRKEAALKATGDGLGG